MTFPFAGTKYSILKSIGLSRHNDTNYRNNNIGDGLGDELSVRSAEHQESTIVACICILPKLL